MPFTDHEKLIAAYDLLQQISGVNLAPPGEGFWYNEHFPWSPTVPPSKVWSDFFRIPSALTPAQADAAVVANPDILEKRKIRLTVKIDSNNRAYLARTIWGDNTSDLLGNGIQPSLFQVGGGPSNGYVARLYRGDPDSGGIELPTTYLGGPDGSPSWSFNYSVGIVLVSTDHRVDFKSLYDTYGLWVVWYRYIGRFVSESAPKYVPFIDATEVTVSHNLGRRPVVQILVSEPSHLFGEDGFGEMGFGPEFSSYSIMSETKFKVFHQNINSFKLTLNNVSTGEIIYI
jgi:hypothetical protein